MMESDSGTVLDPPYPITVIAQFDLQDTWSAQIGQYQLPSLCRVPLTFDRKSMPIVAWYMLSKESYIKRVIRDVFPTAYPYQHLQTVRISVLHTTLFAEEDQSIQQSVYSPKDTRSRSMLT
jgi:hypothetical protein